MKMSAQLHVLAALPPRKEHSVLIGYEAVLAPEPIKDIVEKREISCPCRKRYPNSSAVQDIV
jgi:hypothetical protein